MKVLRIISTMNPSSGGPCQGIRNSIPSQAKLGVQNEVICFDTPGASYSVDDPFPVHRIGPATGPYSYCSNLKKWLKNNMSRFDTIIIHGLWLYNSYGTYSVWSQTKKKGDRVPSLYVMPHGMLDPYFQKARERRIKALRNLIFWELIESKVVSGVDGLLFTCEQELLLARKTFHRYTPKAELNVGYGINNPPLYNEIFEKEFLQKTPGLKGRPYFLFLSRIHPKKGLDILIKAYLNLKKIRIDIPDLVIAGPGFESSYGRLIKKIGDDTNIHFTGMLSGNSKWGALYGCTAFILPSHQENFGIAVVEALACSRPVLISDQVNIWREIEKNQAGLVSVDNEEGVFEILKKWVEFPPDMHEKFCRNARKTFDSYFQIDEASSKWVQVIKKELVEQ